MRDARDAEDTRLLEAGEHKLLLATYFHPVRERCLARLRNREQADEVAQRVFVRLLSELARGKRYSCPFRVVVWMVTDFALRDAWSGPRADPLDDWDAAVMDTALEEWEAVHDLAALLADLPPRQREVAELRYLHGLDHERIAERLGMTRNAVDQALHNAHRRLREHLGG